MNDLKQVNRRFCKITFQSKPLLCLANGSYFAGKAFKDGHNRTHVSGSKFGLRAGDDDLEYANHKQSVEEVTDEEIIQLMLDDRLNENFLKGCHQMLELEPLRPKEPWE